MGWITIMKICKKYSISKIPASKATSAKNEKETEEPYYKYCYGKWIRVQTEKPKD